MAMIDLAIAEIESKLDSMIETGEHYHKYPESPAADFNFLTALSDLRELRSKLRQGIVPDPRKDAPIHFFRPQKIAPWHSIMEPCNHD